jgi:predicted transcriptional regulator
MKKKTTTTVRLTTRADELLVKIAEKLGTSKTTIIEMAIRKFAEKESVS